jgi:predicted P-loop ATPase
MLVLDGPQGSGKSFFVQWLGSVLPDYFIEASINPDDKDSWVRLMAKFVWEVGELGAVTRRADREALKNFITTRIVTLRKAYGKYDTIKPAMASLIGTINNEAGFLTDQTGNRRFLICRLTAIDWRYVQNVDPHQLWAEAVALFKAGEPSLPAPAEVKLQNAINEEYLVDRPLEMMLLKYFEIKPELEIWLPAMDIITRLETLGLRGNQTQNLKELAQVMKSWGVKKGRPSSIPGRPTSYRGVYDRSLI